MKTTKINILQIETGAQYENQIWDYWIIASLENGEVITIFDSDCLIKNYTIGDSLQVIITALFATTRINIDNRLFLINKIEKWNDFICLSNDNITVYINNEDVDFSYTSTNMIFQVDSFRLKSIVIA
jgi:hypothetical protein